MIGLDISDRSIKITRLSNDRRNKLLSYCWAEVPKGLIDRGVVQDNKEMEATLEKALKSCRLSLNIDDAVVASIPETESFLRVLQIPRMKEDEIGEAIQWEVSSHIPFGVENVYLDWQEIGASKNRGDKMEILVGAAEKKVVDPLHKVLKSIGLDVAAFELESQAIVRSLVSPELKAKKGLLIIDLGGSATNVVIHDRGTIRFTATLRKGAIGLVSRLPANERALVSGTPKKLKNVSLISTDKMTPAVNDLCAEIHAIVESYLSINKSSHVNEILLTGGGANVPGVGEAFISYFPNVHTQRANPWVNALHVSRRRAPLPLAESVHYSTALGLALRNALL